jgi:hypothetical protein
MILRVLVWPEWVRVIDALTTFKEVLELFKDKGVDLPGGPLNAV